MSTSIEIKARVQGLEELLLVITDLADTGPGCIAKDDTFFSCPNGRLKIRVLDSGAEGADLLSTGRWPRPEAFLLCPFSDCGTRQSPFRPSGCPRRGWEVQEASVDVVFCPFGLLTA